MSPRAELASRTATVSQRADRNLFGDNPEPTTKFIQESRGSSPSIDDLNPPIDGGSQAEAGESSSPGGDSKARIVYSVQFRDGYGRIIKAETADHPPDVPNALGHHTVLEISSIFTVARKHNSDSESSSETEGVTGNVDALYDSKPYNISSKTVTIHSTKLANALRAVVKYSPIQSLSGRSISFKEPYSTLFHHFEALKAYRDSHPPGHSDEYKRECNNDIDLLLDVLEHEKPEVAAEKERYRRSSPVCSFNLLWLLFKPGEACYRTSETGERSAYIIRAVTGGSFKGRPAPYKIYMWQFNFDGYQVGREISKVVIAPFGGEKEIRYLECLPCKFYEESTEDLAAHSTLRQRLIARGEKFWKMTKDRPYVEYDGTNLVYPFEPIRSRVVVDPKSYFSSPKYFEEIEKMNKKMDMPKPHLIGLDPPRNVYSFHETHDDREMKAMTLDGDITIFTGCQCDACSKARFTVDQGYNDFAAYAQLINPMRDPPNEDEFFFLCGYKVVAYVLREGKWKLLNVERAKEVTSRSNAFDNLVLEPELKEIVEGLSRSYSRRKLLDQKPITTDFIKGKGEGQVFLLHGPPGVGKTATAEAIADYTQRPLLALTCGDLGTYANEVELKLRQYLDWGELWGAVVLLDEADIYLEKRNLTDVHRNSLVSVFLKALEYYKGLLFLTTNRVSTFDEAFTSRIHVALNYKKLQNSERREIWLNSFERLKSDRVKVARAAQKYTCESKEVLDLKWNGREIRNAFQTAISLAEFDAEEERDEVVTVRREHFEKVVRLSAHFQAYLASVHNGKSESELAKRRGLRNDSYGEPLKVVARKPLFRNRLSDEDEEEEDEEEDRRLRRKPDKNSKQMNGRSKYLEEDSDEDPPRKSTKGKRPVRYDDDEDEDSENHHLPKRSARSKKPARSDEDVDSDGKPAGRAARSKKVLVSDEEEEERPRAKKVVKKAGRLRDGEDEE